MSQAQTIKKTFSRETSVSIDINADEETIWRLLTDGPNYPKWNSTVTSIDGNIAQGSTIKLKSILDANRTFKLKVKVFEPSSKLVWGDSMGNRTYQLTKNPKGGTTFTMVEKIGGPIFPLFASKIPSFDTSFNAFAEDLKKEAERSVSV